MMIGLKVYCTNDAYVAPARTLFAQGAIDFIEVFLVPGRARSAFPQWLETGIPLSLHAPHSVAGFNPSLPADFEKNLETMQEVAAVRRMFSPLYVVFHSGVDGNLTESIRQFSMMMERFPELRGVSLIENKPVKGVNGMRCLGTTPEDIELMMAATGMGFLLDFGHAACAAASSGNDYKPFIQRFLRLSPRAFHLSDGLVRSEDDQHLHIGRGDYDIEWFAEQIVDGRTVALECTKDSPDSLDDAAIDVAAFKRFARG
jgi:deoxyribonuclease-4